MSTPIKKKRKASSDSPAAAQGKKPRIKATGKKKIKPGARDGVKAKIKANVAGKVRQRKSQGKAPKVVKKKAGEKVAGSTAVTHILKFLTENMNKDSNYCVALLSSGDLIISKVNGVTARAGGMSRLKAHIESKDIEVGRDIYLAQKYNTAVGSNHAEMCIVAAAGQLGQTVTEMACTGPNCPYCATYLANKGISSRNEGDEGKSQQGWAHPTEKYFWGSQVRNAAIKRQVEDLKSYLEDGTEPVYASSLTTAGQGKYTAWV